LNSLSTNVEGERHYISSLENTTVWDTVMI